MVLYAISGTPGVGKSKMAQQLVEETGLVWREVSKLAIENQCHEEYDEVLKCPILNEDKVRPIIIIIIIN